MANCLIRIGILILLSGQILLGYYRYTQKEFVLGFVLEGVKNYQNENPFVAMFFPNGPDMQPLRDVYWLDIFIELAVPVLMVFTGWRIWLLLSLIHFIITPSFIYNLLGSNKNEFQEVMSIMTILQILGVFLYITSVRKFKAIPH